MTDCIAHIFSNRSGTLINDLKTTNRLCIVVLSLLVFLTPLFTQAQHLDNRKRLDSFQRARTATTSSILSVLANTYNVTGGGAYCNGGSGVAVGLDGSQSDTTYQLKLNGLDIGSPITGNGNAISFGPQTAAGTYTVFANTSTGPVQMGGSATVVINPLPTPTAGSNTPQCAGSTLNLTVSAGSTYSWTGPNGFTSNAQNPSITNVTTAASGTYTVVVTNGNGCSATTTTNVTINALPITTAGSNSPQCAGSTLNLTATGSGTYNWTGPNGFTSNVQNPSIANVTTTQAGLYAVTATVNGCTGPAANTTIVINPQANVTPGGPNTVCQSTSPVAITLSGASVGGSASTGAWSITSGGGSLSNTALTNRPENVTYTPAANFTGTVTLTLTTNDPTGPCPAVSATRIINVTPAAMANAGSAQTVCAGGTITLAGTINGSATNSTWTASSGTFSNISSLTSTYTPSITTGNVTLTLTTNDPDGAGPCSAATSTVILTVNPRPAVPTSPVSATRCGPGTASISATSAAGTTIDWYDAASGGTLLGTGATFTTPSISTSTTYYAEARNTSTGCVSVTRTTATVTINALPVISVTPSSAAFCSGNSVTLTASGANTYTWSPSTNLSITTGSTVNAFPVVTTTYTVTGTAANGCTGTASVPITVTTSPGGDLSSSPPVCPGSNSGAITLSNYTGAIVRWETSTDGGTNWTTVNNTGTTLPYLNLTTTTIYRVYLQLNGCSAYSHVGIVPVNPPFTPTVTVNPASICPGQSATLRASDYGAPPFPVEDFQRANPAGWSGNDANNNNKGNNSEWGETGNGKTFNGLLWNSNAPPTNSKYMIVNGDGGGSIVSLITPPFSLVGLTNPIFNYYTAMNLNVGSTAWVEISTDGGTNYNTLKTYTGPTNVGNPNNGFIQESINLSAYIGQPNVRVRFRYSGTAGSNWGIDNVGIGGTYQPVTYQWSPLTYLSPANGVGQTVTTTPTVSGAYNYCAVATTAAGCSSSPVCINLTVKPLPSCSISGNDSICPASTNTYSAPASLNAYSWSITGKGTISGSSTGQTVSVLAARTCGTYTLNLTTTLNGCTSTCSRTFTIYDTTRPVITVTASGTVGCNPAAAAILAAFGTATVTDNCTPGLTASFTDGAEQGTGCIRTVTRTWTVTDSCGNSATASQTVSFTRDTQGPQFVGVPANTTVQCDEIPAAPAVTASDNCSPSVAVTYAEVNNVVEGCGTITRTWSSTDLCGNTSTATQTLTVVDTTRPVITGVPANETVQCTNTIIAGPSVTATDNCDPTITVNFTETNNVVQGCGTITRTWTATDACGNTATATQIVTVIDNTAPVATAPATQSVQCLADVPPAGTLTATDNCSGNITATGVDVQVANGCGFTITRTWTFTDACNNTSTVSQIINVRDNIPPVVTCPPAQVFCAISSNTYTIPPATATDNCVGALNFTYQITGATTRSGTGNDASGVFNVGISTITWTVTDACGNAFTCTTTVTINPKPAPLIYHN